MNSSSPPSFSPSLTMSSSPMTGAESLDVTGRFAESSFVPGRHHEGAARLARDGLQVGALDVGRRADEHRLRQLQLQLFRRLLRRERREHDGQQEGQDDSLLFT